MSNFINTIDVLGDEAVLDSLIDRSITEFKDNVITFIGTRAFSDCTALHEVDLPNVTTINSEAFSGCSSLVKFSCKELTALTSGVFYNCSSLTELDVSSVTSAQNNCLYGCNSLTELCFSSLPALGQQTIKECHSLRKIDFHKLTKFESGYHLQNAKQLIAVIIRTEAVCTLQNTNTFTGTPIESGTGYIYVPRALVNSYKTATNWSNFASQFRALEDYTVDGTTTGDIKRCTDITLNASELTFTEDIAQTLIPTFNPPPPYMLDNVTWSSSDRKVANVVDGVITPRRDGTAIVTITCGDASATCLVTVNANIDYVNILTNVGFNTGYLNNNGAVGSATATSDTYTNRFDISGYAGDNIVVTLLDVKAKATKSRICYYDGDGKSVGYQLAATASNGAAIASTVPSNAVYAAISINKSDGFSGIKIVYGDDLIGYVDYTS